VAVDDAYNTDEDVILNVVAPGVLGNDTDFDMDPLTASLVQGPSDGTVTLNLDGSFQYTPDADFNGTDYFIYDVNDGTVDSNLATVTITVDPVNDASAVAVNDAYNTDEDVTLNVVAPGVLGNDTDVDGDPLTAVLDTGPISGTLTLNSDGSFQYTPDADFNGTDTFSYAANDGFLDSNIATVTITVDPVNDAPVAVSDTYTTDEDVILNVVAPGVLGNDTDVDVDTLTASLALGPSHGTLTLNLDGSFQYTPDADFNGSDYFIYDANDGTADSNLASVTITVDPVNDGGPVAVNDSYTTDEDVTLNVVAPGVLDNDTDVDGDPLTAFLDTGPISGTLTLNLDGSFQYTPDADFYGTDTFAYIAIDGFVASNVATVTITVDPVNDAPVAVDEVYTTDEDVTLNVVLPGVLDNDTDVEGDPLTAVLDTGPISGTLTLNSDGSFQYTPNADFYGTDTFSYVANDSFDVSNVATVTITVDPVDDAPVAVDDSYTTNQNTTLNVVVPGVLGNDTDADGDALTASLETAPGNGSLTLYLDGSFEYIPDAGFTGTDTFTYAANDGTEDSNVATVTISVNHVIYLPMVIR
jgi:VCBS repeat-containing protein